MEAPAVVKGGEIKEKEDIRVRGEEGRSIREGRRRRRRERYHRGNIMGTGGQVAC